MIGTYLEKTNTERGVCNFIEFAVKKKSVSYNMYHVPTPIGM
jgi:hypothetical protein